MCDRGIKRALKRVLDDMKIVSRSGVNEPHLWNKSRNEHDSGKSKICSRCFSQEFSETVNNFMIVWFPVLSLLNLTSVFLFVSWLKKSTRSLRVRASIKNFYTLKCLLVVNKVIKLKQILLQGRMINCSPNLKIWKVCNLSEKSPPDITFPRIPWGFKMADNRETFLNVCCDSSWFRGPFLESPGNLAGP